MGLHNRVVCQEGDEENLRESRCGCGCCCEVKTQKTAYVSHMLKEMRCAAKADKILQNVPIPITRALKDL